MWRFCAVLVRSTIPYILQRKFRCYEPMHISQETLCGEVIQSSAGQTNTALAQQWLQECRGRDNMKGPYFLSVCRLMCKSSLDVQVIDGNSLLHQGSCWSLFVSSAGCYLYGQ